MKESINLSAVDSAPVEVPEPFHGAGSGLNYFDSAEKKQGFTGAKIDPDYAENYNQTMDYNLLKPDELLPHYLRYVLKHLDTQGLYRKKDKEVREDMQLTSEDKAQRVKRKAIEMGFLVPQVERKQYLSPQRGKINRYLNQIRGS